LLRGRAKTTLKGVASLILRRSWRCRRTCRLVMSSESPTSIRGPMARHGWRASCSSVGTKIRNMRSSTDFGYPALSNRYSAKPSGMRKDRYTGDRPTDPYKSRGRPINKPIGHYTVESIGCHTGSQPRGRLGQYLDAVSSQPILYSVSLLNPRVCPGRVMPRNADVIGRRYTGRLRSLESQCTSSLLPFSDTSLHCLAISCSSSKLTVSLNERSS
jgi:hypothetical protein